MRQFKLVNSTDDAWVFYATSELLQHRLVGGQTEMADGSFRKWFRCSKRRWTITLEELERSDKWMLLRFAENVNNLKFYADDLNAGEDYVMVLIEIDKDFDFPRLMSDEILYNTSFVLREA